ncbi:MULTISPECIES: extracellular solute-binding protein [Rhizobium]|uniref:extracellular solute-binding protein n=1 Tax=Rhizobium TaxID=379 RepID=UPI0007EA4E20|nr:MULTISPECIES: extracellular solute-binding protein [Rhizobium]ANK95515.1 spermidine/putrescine ABC transporter substrate-binding protein [Rhizobium sp. N6212]ANL01567.1 spermidine/putrescine ABC transporter substrate-binding protein [Rhizobium sp. N621]ANL07695.1 spermidine/putrescine ABC transporter substrate-binding protein [Rhizobium esperanzae]ANL13866.1 spermidine/putrescine ABC transporter substrate-binding protein [Rhizobium sp. N1341]ANL25849.1 spermidine/putrescine ABC transporter 
MKKRTEMKPFLLAACLMLGSLGVAQAEEQVVIATTGGAYDVALRKFWFEPFTRETGIKVVSVAATNAEMRAKAAAMVKTGNVTWDLYPDGEIQASAETHRLTSEDLSNFCEPFRARPDLVEDACISSGARLFSTATLMAYDPTGFKAGNPSSWADMWDQARFPGGRAFPNFDDPWRVMAAALLADGVPRDKLFPLDIDRALRKLDEIRPAISLWWKTGDQSVQGFRNGDYSIGQIWLTRANTLKAEGRPIAWSTRASFLVGDRLTIIKGAPNRANAEKLVGYWLDHPATQARVCEELLCTPPSRKAISLMSPAARAALPSDEDIRDHIVIPDARWINENAAMMLERWNAWIR